MSDLLGKGLTTAVPGISAKGEPEGSGILRFKLGLVEEGVALI